MISLSHWGMFTRSIPFPIVPLGYKLSSPDLVEFQKLGGIVEITRLEKGEPQPIYVAPDEDCA